MNKNITHKFPFLEISGGYKEIGTAIGTKFKTQIQARIAWRKKRIDNYNELLKQTEPFFKATKEAFPHLIVELEAIANSSDVPVVDFFFLNNREVFDTIKTYDHCTIAVGFNKDGAIVGHNEDWALDEINDLYVLKANFNNKVTILGLQYFEALGVSATMNSFGLVQCINDLSAVTQVGVPKNFIARAILECQTLDEAEKIIRTTKCASGFNHVLVQGNEVRNIEISGDKIAVDKKILEPYVHTNHFLSPEMQNEPAAKIPSSIPRYERAKELIRSNMSFEDIKALLSDTQNIEFPICRPKETIGSIIFEPEKRTGWFCYGHPCMGEYIKYSL